MRGCIQARLEKCVILVTHDMAEALALGDHIGVMEGGYFPPYDAVPVARASTLLRYPQMRKALEGLAGQISADMREMNYAADGQHENPADIARRFLNRAR